MALREDLELDIGAALASVDRLESTLTGVAQRFKVELGDALSALNVQVDVSAVAPAIDSAIAAADSTVEISGDAEAVGAAVTDAVGSADATVEVEADVGAAEADIESLSGAEVTVDVTANTEQAQEDIGDLGGVAGAADAELGGLAATMKGIGPKALAAAGGTAALALGTKEAFTSAVDATGSLQAFEQALGESADTIRTVNVGDFSADLNELAISLGSSDEGLQDAAVRIFSLGEASGIARPEVEKTTESIIALAARAVAIRPSLGEVGTVAEGLSNALARGGRPLAAYGIALTGAEIEARALSDTGKTLAADLTIFEKSAAGAALASEQLGDSISGDIAAGTQNPILRLRALTEKVGELFETIGEPLVAPGLDALEGAMKVLEPLAEGLALTLKILAEAESLVADKAGKLAGAIGDVIPGLDKVGDLLPDIGFKESTVDIEAMIRAQPELADKLGLVAESAGNADTHIEEINATMAKTAVATGEYTQSQINAAVATATAAGETDIYTAAMEGLRESQVTAADGAQLEADTLAALATKMIAGTVTTQDFTDTAAILGVTVEELAGLMPLLTESVDAFVNNAVAKFPTASDALRDLNDNGKVSAQEFIQSLEGQAQAIDKFAIVVALATEQGFGNLVDFLTNEGPEVLGPDGPFAAALASGNVAELALLDQKIGNLEQHAVLAGDVLRAAAGPLGISATALADQISQEYGVKLNLTLPIDRQTPEAQAALKAAGVVLGPEGAAAGAEVAGEFEKGADLEASIRRNVALGRQELAITGGILSGFAVIAGREVGEAFDAGIALGIITDSSVVREAARFAVSSAAAAARAAAQIGSPSKLFAQEIGVPIAQGIAQGIESGGGISRSVDNLIAGGASTGLGSVTGGGVALALGGIQVDVTVHGNPEPGTGKLLGDQIGVGVAEQIQHMIVDVRNN